MRHSAKFVLIFGRTRKGKEMRFQFFTPSGGDNKHVREVFRKAIHGHRRRLRLDPERVAVNFVGAFMNSVDADFYFHAREEEVAWTWRFELALTVPRVIVRYPDGDTTGFNLFEWLGSERRKLADTPHPAKILTEGKQKRRGRPSILQKDPRIREKMKGVQVPYRIDPVLGPVDKHGKPIKN